MPDTTALQGERSGLLSDEEKVLLRQLVIFQMPAYAARVGKRLQGLGDAEDAIINRRSHRGVVLLRRFVEPSCRPDEDTTGCQGPTEFSQDCFVVLQRNVPDAVPRRDEVVLPGWRPFARIGMVDGDIGAPFFRKRYHLLRHIEAFHLVSVVLQQADEAAIASRSDVERDASVGSELECVLVLANPVRLKMRFQPSTGDGIVAFADLGRLHGFRRQRDYWGRLAGGLPR